MRSGIYKITNEVTGKFYIGSSKDVDNRWVIHQNDLKGHRHCNPKLQHSWDFYGEDTFSFLVLEEGIEPEKLLVREQYYLDTFKPYLRGVGYNIGSKAEGGDNITHNPNREAFIEKMSIVSSGENNPMFGKHHSEDTIEKQKKMAAGRFTLEWFKKHYPLDGDERYKQRCECLSRRKIQHVYDNGQRGMVKGPPSELSRQKQSETKSRMRQIKENLIVDISSGTFSMKQLCEKHSIGMNVVKYYKYKTHPSSLK